MTDSTSKPPLVTVAAEFDRLTEDNPEVIALLHELNDNAENPDYQPRTYGQLFQTEDGIQVGDVIYPGDFPGLSDKPIVLEDYKAPARAVDRLALQMQRATKRLGRALNTFKKRSTQRAKAHVRTIKGGKQIVDVHNHRLSVSRLRPFAGQAPLNELRNGKRGFDVSIGSHLPTTTQPLFKLPKAGDGFERKLERKLREACQSYAHNLLDHTQSVVMASSTVTGHDKVVRLLQLHIQITTDDGDSYESTYTQINQKRGALTAVTQIPTHEGPLAGNFEISGQLSYEFRCARSKVAEVTQVLNFLEDLPLFRNVSGVGTPEADVEAPSDDDLFGDIELGSEEDAFEVSETVDLVAGPLVVSVMTPAEVGASVTAILEVDEDLNDDDLVELGIPQEALDLLAQFESAGVAPTLPVDDIEPPSTSFDTADEIFGFDFSMPESSTPRNS
jgi:hypothetical protein